MQTHRHLKLLPWAFVIALVFPGPLWGIAVGNRVASTDSLNVRSCAGTSCTLLTTVPSGTRGTVQSGPTSANGFVWWRVAWDSGTTGWSVQDFMVVVPGNLTLSGNPYCNTSPPPGPAVLLSWTASQGATSYTVFRNGSQLASGVSGTTFDNNLNVAAGQIYTYFVRANNSNGTTSSSTISISVPSTVCGSAPGSFTVSGTPYCNTSTPVGPAVLLSWTVSQGAMSYTVFRNGSQIGNSTNGTTFDNTLNVVAGQTYSYVVQASNSVGTKNSNTLSMAVPSNVCSTATCFALSRTHTGSGSNPQVSPANSAGCPSGQYVAGAALQLSASPDSGWSVGSWSGTSNNASTSTTNQATMPAASHTVGVSYAQNPAGPDLDVLEISLFEPHYPDGAPDGIPTGGAGTTVDGNPVTIRARIKNFGGAAPSIAVRWTVDGHAIGSENFSFAANQERTLEKVWDTAGFGWHSDGGSQGRAREIEVEAVGHDAESVDLLVRPRPLILVHGLWSDAATWVAYGPAGLGGSGGFVPDAHPLWQSYAVGDGFAPDLVMNTGKLICFPNPCPAASYEDNARVLGVYLARVREAANAWTVDMVAHSMGGLIAREYIYRYMRLAPALPGRLPVKKLLTLGTPHLGTPCSRYSIHSGIWLSEEYVQSHFSGFPLFGVELHTMGSALPLTCPVRIDEISLFDPVVNLGSALFEGFADSSTTRFTLHTSMTGSQDDFEEFVLPILAGREPERETAITLPEPPKLAGTGPSLLLHSGQSQFAESGSNVSTVVVPAAERLAVLLLAGDEVALRLSGPGGQLPPEQGAAPFRYFEVNAPQPGSWRLELTSLDGNPPLAEFSWYVDGSAYSSQLVTESTGPATRFRVTLRRNGLALTGAPTIVEAVATGGAITQLQLWDDGQHGDLLPNDGVYGQLAGLAPGAYQCRAKSMVEGFSVGSASVAIVEGGAIFANGFESGDLSAWSVFGPVGSTVLLFADDFDDGQFDPDHWTWYGHGVQETGGEQHVDCTVTDQGGGADTEKFRISPEGLIRMTRRLRVGAGNHFFDGTIKFHLGNDVSTDFGMAYSDYENTSPGECVVHGFALFRNEAITHVCANLGVDVTAHIPGVWGAWFEEKLEWDPATGAAAYFIDGQNVLNLNVGPLPAGAKTLQLRIGTWGWYTGHYQHSDDLRVTQEAQ